MYKKTILVHLTAILATLLVLSACSSANDNNKAGHGDIDSDGDIDTEDISSEEDKDSDFFEERAEDNLPEGLPFEYTRPDAGEPLSPEEVDTFTQKMIDFYKDTAYFDWLLRMSHGIDASTGKRDYRLWWRDCHAVKDGDKVTMVHNYSEEHGGHNILKVNSNILSSAIGGYLLTGNETLGKLSEQYCKGISSTMLGMVHDENDTVLHLMTRNVVTFNHSYKTHDGYDKAVDYSKWFFPYDRWNCSRFSYENNPYWGEVWITNTRSKDGLGYLFDASVPILYASLRAQDEEVRLACSETIDLLQKFTKDIVDNGYNIRTKDAEGNPYTPGIDEGPEEADTGDLASFVTWDLLLPDAECNNKQAAALLAYGDLQDNECTPFGGNKIYEKFSIENNAPNGHIMRAFHIANIKLSLLNGYNDKAQASLEGLDERFTRDMANDLSKVNTSPDGWLRDLISNKLQAAGAGYPMTSEEVRLLHNYLTRSTEAFSNWPTWNLWDKSVADGEHEWLPPDYEKDDEGARIYRIGSEALALIMEYCWSPFKNPDGVQPVNCEMLSNL